MEMPFDEGIEKRNGLFLPVQCLVMPMKAATAKWNRFHYHDYIELLYTVKGSVSVNVCEKEYTMPENSAVIINAGEPHSTAGSGERTLLCIKFLPQTLFSLEQYATEFESMMPYIAGNFGSKRFFDKEFLTGVGLHKVFSEIYREHRDGKFACELTIRADVIRIFAQIIRYWHDQAVGNSALSGSAAAVIRKAREYTGRNYAEATLESAARACGTSYSYFSRLFSFYMRMGYSDYLNRVKVNESLKLLTTTGLSITEIAMAVGFSSTSYYIRVFRELRGISPGKLRKKMLSETCEEHLGSKQ